MTRRVLIVGSRGQDGRLLYERLVGEGDTLLGLDVGAVESTDSAAAPAAPVDILQPEAVATAVKGFRPDEIYYLAAYHHSSEGLPPDEAALLQKSFAINVTGLLNFLAAMHRHAPACRLFYAASSHVFGHTEATMQDEGTPFNPVCAYGITKAAGVHLCRYYRNEQGLFAATGILYNHESLLRRPEFVSQKIIRGAMAIRQGQQTTLTLGNLAAQVDWGFAPDTVDAMVRIVRHAAPDDFVVATGQLHSVQEFVEEVFGRLGLDWRQTVREDPSVIRKRSRALVGNADKLRNLTGWRPTVTFSQMVGLLLEARETAR
jgi:GDPmannose 4,6-dehydratase